MTTAAPPAGAAEVGGSESLPAPLNHIWESFARRELTRGRRDVANLIEVTLQFLLEHESKGLAPMVATLELIHSWSDALKKELALARRLAAQHPGALPKPHPLTAITMVRSEQGVASLMRQTLGEPATTAAQLKAFAQSLDKQLVLVQQAEAEHTAALQGKRGAIADTFRHHAILMHASAHEIIASLPAAPPPKPPPVAKAEEVVVQEEPAATPGRRSLRDLLPSRSRLQALRWSQLSPVGLARACAQALIRGYRQAPDGADGAFEPTPRNEEPPAPPAPR